MCPDAAITVIDEEKEGGGENVKAGKREDGKTGRRAIDCKMQNANLMERYPMSDLSDLSDE
jgi:hypothetical protein